MTRKEFKGSISRLCLAIRSGAFTEVIDLLTQPKKIYTFGLDNVTLSMFAESVKSDLSLQERIIEMTSERLSMAFLTMELFLNVLAITAFLAAIDSIIDDPSKKNQLWEIDFCVPMFTLFEAVQFVSQQEQYLLDPWNYYKVILLSLMVASRIVLYDHCSKENNDHSDIPESAMRIFTSCGILLIGNAFFYLRQTFLPFAKLLQGLVSVSDH